MKTKTIIILGILLIVGGFMYDLFFAGIPYQDPTPEMTQRFNFNKSVASTIELIGLIVIIIGIIKSILNKLLKK